MVERVRLAGNVAVEGQFEPPHPARVDVDDRVFVAAFVRSHAAIKKMERNFGVSYPTIRLRPKGRTMMNEHRRQILRMPEYLRSGAPCPAPAGPEPQAAGGGV
ncbi:DUF2089 family protein [Streptomyces sp. NPDC048680]|uniref:DUF2089 family protein n=1 Tax=Streptomyces sp. NPDC048680 TaxID=3155492 RepID=UPI003449FDD3